MTLNNAMESMRQIDSLLARKGTEKVNFRELR